MPCIQIRYDKWTKIYMVNPIMRGIDEIAWRRAQWNYLFWVKQFGNSDNFFPHQQLIMEWWINHSINITRVFFYDQFQRYLPWKCFWLINLLSRRLHHQQFCNLNGLQFMQRIWRKHFKIRYPILRIVIIDGTALWNTTKEERIHLKKIWWKKEDEQIYHDVTITSMLWKTVEYLWIKYVNSIISSNRKMLN